MNSAFRRCVAERRACAFGLIVATCPAFATSIRFSLETAIAQQLQYLSPVLTSTPQIRQTADGHGLGLPCGLKELPFTGRRWAWVSLVGA
jgi:hypothetical protein